MLFSDDYVAAIHMAALGVLEREGIKILRPEAHDLLARAGARVIEDVVHLGADLVAEALRTAPRQWVLRAANPARQRLYAPGQMLFSPRQIDEPMAQGINDFAREGQVSISKPFCLAGAMAPITVVGALVLQHAKALAGITLAQMARPGAPVSYCGFSSNVDMKSGAPAFGTPAHLRMRSGRGKWRGASVCRGGLHQGLRPSPPTCRRRRKP